MNGGNAKKALPVDVEADDLSEAIKVSRSGGPFRAYVYIIYLSHTHTPQ